MPFWQYANMASANIFYIRRVANDDEAPNRIAELRGAKGMSQAELARQANCDQSTINKIEHGQRGLDQVWMRRLAPILGVTPAELLPREDNPYLLSDEERSLVERLRGADARGRDTLHTLAAALVSSGDKEEKDRA